MLRVWRLQIASFREGPISTPHEVRSAPIGAISCICHRAGAAVRRAGHARLIATRAQRAGFRDAGMLVAPPTSGSVNTKLKILDLTTENSRHYVSRSTDSAYGHHDCLPLIALSSHAALFSCSRTTRACVLVRRA